MKIKKAVIPIAGKGTRFLPATKQIAKEIIPILNIPMIHHVVMEAVDSGIEQIIFVTSAGKFAVEDYFDRNQELEAFLEKTGKTRELEMIRKIGTMVDVTSVRQKEQLGLGHAVLCARELVDQETFAVLLGDDIVVNKTPCIKQLIEVSETYNGAPVIGAMEVPLEHTSRYGIISGTPLATDPRTLRMQAMVEKPRPAEAPSRLATPGRYILSPDIFDVLLSIPRGAGNEYQLTDAINVLCSRREVYAHLFGGERFDTGNLVGYLEATIDFALRDPELKGTVASIIRDRLKRHGVEL
ncbi:MAG: UTP--glucose-1-phosphate uridylyltransferase [Bacteriovoracia bacterium]